VTSSVVFMGEYDHVFYEFDLCGCFYKCHHVFMIATSEVVCMSECDHEFMNVTLAIFCLWM
jgi:hypothetical protein